MSTIYADSPVQSLVEKKKQQWAREREELASVSEHFPWSNRDSLQLYDKPCMRPRYASKYQKETDCLRRDSNASSAPTPARRQSLPPLHKNQNFTYTSNEKLDKEMGGETSGYGSDNPNQTPEHFPQTPSWSNHHLGYESSSSGREDRLKWGDRGVHVGKFWEPKDVENFTKNNDAPGWVKRGLERDTELIHVTNTSPAESPEQDFVERPGTSSTISQNSRSHIRGQNVPVDASELAEREKRRQIALLHQEAIRQQLEEREKRRQEEKARKAREEYEEEMRIAREREIERERRDREQRMLDEKQERERKRKEALREAIEIAEKEAREERLKMKMHKQNMNMTENVVEVEKVKSIKPPPQSSEESDEVTEPHEEVVKDNAIVVENSPRESVKNNNVTNAAPNNVNIALNQLNNALVSQENLALMLQTPIESFQNAQFAVLIPAMNTSNTNSLPIAVPIPLYTDRSNVSTARTENRVLTPTQYRNRKVCDSSTQTDYIDFKQFDNREKYVREKLSSLDVRCKERRSRSEVREMVEDRPKWGVNRPPTRYLKQSEKDPLYQRRKLRQKMRQVKVYGDKCINYNSPHSSDESPTGSPRTYRKRGYTEKRGRALWRKNEEMFSENVRVYQTEIVPLEADKDHIYFKTKHQCCCRCSCRRDKVDILKIEHNTPRDDERTKLPAFTNSSIDEPNVLEKLSSLHNGLMLRQDHWDDTPRHSIHYSPRHP